LDKTDYGAFTVGYTVFLLIGVIFNGILVEPMLVFGSGRYKKSVKSYLKQLITLHWKWGWMGSAILVGGVSVLYRNSPSFGTLVALALVGGLILYQWILRRACYVNFKPRLAAEGGVLYLGSVSLGIVLMQLTGSLTAVNGVIIMAAGSLLAGYWIQHRFFRELPVDEDLITGKEILNSHWDYGRWAVLVNILSWIPGNIYLVVLPVWQGESASAELKAAFNLILPVQQLLAAIGPLLLPILVGARDEEGFFKKVLIYSGLISLPPIAWTLFLSVFGENLSEVFYHGKYSDHGSILLILGLQTVLGSIIMVIAGALRAMELPKLVVYGYLGAAALCLITGLPLAARFGVTGAALGMLISSVVNILILSCIFLKRKKSSKFIY
jgi:O-antigen/teichoic acid export membrane protein